MNVRWKETLFLRNLNALIIRSNNFQALLELHSWLTIKYVKILYNDENIVK